MESKRVLRSAAKKSPKRAPTTKKQNTKKKTEKSEKNTFSCNQCEKKFAKRSNLNHHAKVKHMGLRWICPFCKKDQASKFSHIRHINSCPDRVHFDGKKEVDADCHSFFINSKVEYTPKAASKIIESLTKIIEFKGKVIIDLQQRLLLSLKRNIALKRIVKVNSNDEEKEIQYVKSLKIEPDEDKLNDDHEIDSNASRGELFENKNDEAKG